MTINASAISGNSSQSGGIFNEGTATIAASTISNNSGRVGGGIRNYNGTLRPRHEIRVANAGLGPSYPSRSDARLPSVLPPNACPWIAIADFPSSLVVRRRRLGRKQSTSISPERRNFKNDFPWNLQV